MCVSAIRPSIRAFPTERDELKAREENKEVKLTVTLIQEAEEEENAQPREDAQIDLPQEFPLVNHIHALFSRFDWVRLVAFQRVFFFGHVWRGERRGGDKGRVSVGCI